MTRRKLKRCSYKKEHFNLFTSPHQTPIAANAHPAAVVAATTNEQSRSELPLVPVDWSQYVDTTIVARVFSRQLIAVVPHECTVPFYCLDSTTYLPTLL